MSELETHNLLMGAIRDRHVQELRASEADAFRRGQEDVYAKVRALPTPLDTTDDLNDNGDLLWTCRWCHCRFARFIWHEDVQSRQQPHPPNGCLWALAARTTPEA